MRIPLIVITQIAHRDRSEATLLDEDDGYESGLLSGILLSA